LFINVVVKVGKFYKQPVFSISCGWRLVQSKRERKLRKRKERLSRENGQPNSQDAQLRREGEADLMLKTFDLIAARADSKPYKAVYFRYDRVAQILGVDILDAKTTFDAMVGMSALEKASGGTYTPTPQFPRVHASYLDRQKSEQARKPAFQ
jgi:hypothetical protein